MSTNVTAMPPTDLCRLIERDGILIQLADSEIGATLADHYLRHIKHCPHCLCLAADIVYTDALVKSSVLSNLGATADARAMAIHVANLVPGQRLPKDCFGPDGALLLMRGTLLSANILGALTARGITTVYLGTPPEVATVDHSDAPEAPVEHPIQYLQGVPGPFGRDAEPPVSISTEEALPNPIPALPALAADIIFRLDEPTPGSGADEIPPDLPEGYFFGERGIPRKFHPTDYRDLLLATGAEPSVGQATKLKAYSQLERSLSALKESGAADLGPVRQTTHQIVDELLRDGQKTLSLADLFLVSSQLFSHCFNTLVVFVSLARALQFDASDITAAGECVLFHDIGRILPADGDEGDDFRNHPQRGYRFLASQGGFNERLLSIVMNHHERVDGRGFARGLKGDQLSLWDQALILANVYDTLITDPVHGVKRSFHRAAQAILQSGGRLVSPAVTHAFLNVFGMYPPGSLVQLKSRELAIVREANFQRPFQPQVTVLMDPQGARLTAPYALDLTEAAVPIERAIDVESVLPY